MYFIVGLLLKTTWKLQLISAFKCSPPETAITQLQSVFSNQVYLKKYAMLKI